MLMALANARGQRRVGLKRLVIKPEDYEHPETVHFPDTKQSGRDRLAFV